ncbi:MAB_1171c family putative transporter (plasmid) [Streptomyces sp. BI20]|uniref:MAB_1171c family putative transporter n=1 Tax=Streptomyces sp. BI20 TaxID=3403460 RepID=UPI003C76DC84
MALWAVAFWRLPAAVRIPRQRPLWTAFAAVAVGCTIARPKVKSLIIEPTGIVNFATLLQHGIGIIGSAAVLFFVVTMARPEALRWARPLLYGSAAGAIGLLALLFALTPRPAEVDNFFAAQQGVAAGTAYCFVFLGYLCAAMAVSSQLFWVYGQRAAGRPLRIGLRLLGAGTAVGALYTLWRIAHMTAHLAGWRFPVGDEAAQTIADVIEYAAIALIILGNSVPAGGVLIRSLFYARALREITPLWDPLVTTAPDVVLAERVGRSPRSRLHRRVIEIADVILILRAYASEGLVARARAAARQSGRPTEEVALLADAMWLRTAWESARTGATAPDSSALFSTDPTRQHATFDAEVAYVRRLAKLFADPVVRRFAAQEQGQPA